jgi:hypothetical protein
MKQSLILSFAVACLGLISYIFWWQEVQYALPTPIPSDYKPVAISSKPIIPHQYTFPAQKPVFLHFFNQDCPCSKFNLEHVRLLVKTYQHQVNFYAVLVTDKEEKVAIEEFKQNCDLPVPVIVDKDKSLAVAFGVYSTPQAVLLNTSHELYFRGNYNKSRYCTQKDTNFAEIALQHLLEGKLSPTLPALATQSYGCSLPDNQTLTSSN